MEPKWPCDRAELETLLEQVAELQHHVEHMAAQCPLPADLHPDWRASAVNLLHYLAMRTVDIRQLQLLLSEWGLSSLGRAERKVMATLYAVMEVLHRLAGRSWTPPQPPPVCHRQGRLLLERHTDMLLGELPSGRRARIMVTMPSEAAYDLSLVSDLLQHGMNVARINTAHDSPEAWAQMVETIRKAESRTGHPCRVLIDLSGPKLRTGPMPPGPEVVKVRPRKNEKGEVVEPARVWLYPAGQPTAPPPGVHACLPLPSPWFEKCKRGDMLVFRDARQARRRLLIDEVGSSGCLTLLHKTAYFWSGMPFRLKREGKKWPARKDWCLDSLPPLPGYLLVKPGDILRLYRDERMAQPPQTRPDGTLEPASLGCTLPEVLAFAAIGEAVWFDDGKIGAEIVATTPDYLELRITHASDSGDKLRAGKGINLPDTRIEVPALTDDDRHLLPFVVEHADLVGMSFVNNPRDVDHLYDALEKCSARLGRPLPGVVLKIETRRGFERLPAILLEAMRFEKVGVMIARGDLAVECGFERLAEVQEQILWVCEAAHVPAIWATQVLEELTKAGLPTRAEISDAALGQRAECIMLNKGEHVVEATRSLDDILRRMQDHQTKKRSLLRKLHLAERFFEMQPQQS